MRDKVLKYALWALIAGLVFWAFDSGMRKQHQMDCAHHRYCPEGV